MMTHSNPALLMRPTRRPRTVRPSRKARPFMKLSNSKRLSATMAPACSQTARKTP